MKNVSPEHFNIVCSYCQGKAFLMYVDIDYVVVECERCGFQEEILKDSKGDDKYEI